MPRRRGPLREQLQRLQRGPARDSTQSSLTNLQADEISLVASLPFSRFGPPSGREHHDQSERAGPYTQFPALPAGRGICRNSNACSKFGLSESHPHAGVAHDLSRLSAGNAIRLGWLKCPRLKTVQAVLVARRVRENWPPDAPIRLRVEPIPWWRTEPTRLPLWSRGAVSSLPLWRE